MVSQWAKGVHGFVPTDKTDGVLRLSAENANSLGIYNKDNGKVQKCCVINNKYDTDGTLLVETGINWSQAPEGKRPAQLFRGGRC